MRNWKKKVGLFAAIFYDVNLNKNHKFVLYVRLE